MVKHVNSRTALKIAILMEYVKMVIAFVKRILLELLAIKKYV